jgi:MFS family permease
MTSTLIALSFLLAVTVAVRSTWSPCGQSMLSTLTPLSERARGHDWWPAVGWFVAGAVLGGLTLGAALSVLAWLASVAGIGAAAGLAVVAVGGLVTAGSDARIVGRELPFHTRQVAESGLDVYRRWVYAAGFGWQIGVGFATYVMTGALYLMVVAAAMTADPLVAFAVGGLFGLVRGLAILLGARATTPQSLAALHRWFESAREPVRRATIAAQLLVVVAAAVATWADRAPAALGAVLAVAAVVGVVGVGWAPSRPEVDPATGVPRARVG